MIEDALKILSDLAKPFESCRLEAYHDPAKGLLTIGWGHTGPDCYPGLKWTQEYADKVFLDDALTALNQAAHVSPVLLNATAGQWAAIGDFCFNIGAGKYAKSTLKTLIDDRHWNNAAVNIQQWDHGEVNGQMIVLSGLKKRRFKEAALLVS
jgi:lysozyme